MLISQLAAFRIIFHLCLRFSRNPLCAVQDARAGDFVVAVFLADRVEGGIEFTAFLLLFGILFSRMKSSAPVTNGSIVRPSQ